ncbi:CPBP family intramembrane metalloprotease [Haloarcula rubripromontorii]|uniref:CPBP family intramembrane metalloprotease n=1 Tax=Haloarcula rubripromontorii TaxID=1705562 RepID=A0A847TSS6_9EURY|nr:CPBP family intramembrane glutamic endopeptidase [Haloarcula rubripromontorii]NLV06203.1 CPBP family intramembrane metalloprotease [Haloarcula rubripromontorii]
MQKSVDSKFDGAPPRLSSPWVFFAITFTITWGFWLPAIVFDLTFDSALGLALLLLGLTGPGSTGVGLMYLLYDESSRNDFWDRVKNPRRIGGWWYVAIFLYPPLTFAVAAVADILLGGQGYTVGAWVPQLTSNPAAFLPTLLFSSLPPVLEELGWRGYALDQLQRTRSALTAGLILGVVWAVWHLPLFLIGGTNQHDVVGFLTLRFWLFMVGVVALSVAFTWIHNGTGGTILASIMLHSWTNFTLQTVEGTLRTDVFFYAIVLWAFVGLVTLVWGAETLTSGDDIPHPTLKTRPKG